jgi:hypothetical protein
MWYKLIFPVDYLQFGNNLIDLFEWFVASVAVLLAVTLIYVFVLNKSPPPEGLTQAKLESYAMMSDPTPIISSAQDALKNSDYTKAVDLAVKAVHTSLVPLLKGTKEHISDMNVSDLAYLVQSKAAKSPDITQPIYQLNLLHLKAAQSQVISIQEAEWAVNTAGWLAQLVVANQIVF